MFRWMRATAALAIVALLAACSTGPAPQTTEESKRGELLTLISVAGPRSLDISDGAEWGNRSPFFQAVFDTLLTFDEGGQLQPWLATEWAYNDDRTVLTLRLRDDATFTDGTPVDAAAVVASMEYFRDGTSPEVSTMAGKTFRVVDDDTFEIVVDAPDASLLELLGRQQGLVQAPSTFGNPDAATQPVGSGPYVLDLAATVIGTTYQYTANPDFWNPDAVKYDRLVINVMNDPTSVVNAIRAGEANGARIANNSSLPEIEAAGWTVEFNEMDIFGIHLLDRAGTLTPELADVRVRRAINLAFDNEALLEATQSGYGTVSEQIFPPTSVAYEPALDSYYGYDPERAKELLAEAGYPDGFTLDMPTTPAYQTTFDLVAQQLADVGITVRYTDYGPGNLISAILSGTVPASWMANEQPGDWRLINSLIAPSAVFNPFRYEDETVNEYIREIQYGTEEEATAAVKALNRHIVEQAWFAPHFRYKGSFAGDAQTEFAFWNVNAFPSIFHFAPKG